MRTFTDNDPSPVWRISPHFEQAGVDMGMLALQNTDFMHYAYFGHLDLWIEHVTNNAVPPLDTLLRMLKQEPLKDDDSRIRDMRTAHDLMDFVFENDRFHQERMKEIAGTLDMSGLDFKRDDRIQAFLSPIDMGLDLSINSRIWHFIQSEAPDQTLSTFMVLTDHNTKKHLIHSCLYGHTFKNDGRFFEGADFTQANLKDTIWDPATTSIKNAIFNGADLRGAKGMTTDYLSTAMIDQKTRLPEGIKHSEIIQAKQCNPYPTPTF